MRVHDLDESLDKAARARTNAWWLGTYREAFPDLLSMAQFTDDCAQRSGIDRILTLPGGVILRIDEKVRSRAYNDILLEYWSVKERKVRGWICKPLQTDYLAYAIEPARVCYLFPFLMLQRAWRENCHEWWALADREERGFRHCKAVNKRWTTMSMAVPTAVLQQAISSAMKVRFAPPDQDDLIVLPDAADPAAAEAARRQLDLWP